MKICCFGSLNIDWVYTVEHQVRAGETLAASALARFPGGKGLNQAVALARAGRAVYHAGKIGHDGQFLAEYLKQNGVNTAFIETISAPSGHAIIQLDASGQNGILVYGGANHTMDTAFFERVLSFFDAGDILLLQNEINLLGKLICLAHARGLRIALNPSPITADVCALPLEYIDFFFLNEIEGAALAGEVRPERIVSALHTRYPSGEVILTLGKEGALCSFEDRLIRQAAFPVRAVDTTAAGDTFTGFYLAARATDMDIAAALRRAAVAAAIAVTRKGASVSIPSMQEVEEMIEHVDQ